MPRLVAVVAGVTMNDAADPGAAGPENFPTIAKLHSDVLEDRFGPIHSVVLRHDDTRAERAGEFALRWADLCDAAGVSRTHALTYLTYDADDHDLYTIDREIHDGGMIGKTFRRYGFEVRKNVIDVFVIDLTEDLRRRFATDAGAAKARFAEFYAKREGAEPRIYAHVLEIYHPEFRPAAVNDVDRAQINPPTEILEAHSITKDDIWGRLDRASETDEWADRAADYEAALLDGNPETLVWRRRIEQFFATTVRTPA
jgi:hypothetical protein